VIRFAARGRCDGHTMLALVLGLGSAIGCGESFTDGGGGAGAAATTSSSSSSTSSSTTGSSVGGGTSSVGGGGAGGAGEAGAAAGGNGQEGGAGPGGAGGAGPLPCDAGWTIPPGISAGNSFVVMFVDSEPWACVQVHISGPGGTAAIDAGHVAQSTYTWTATIPGQPAGQLDLSFQRDCPVLAECHGCVPVSSCSVMVH
jgi:hypothetical protein